MPAKKRTASKKPQQTKDAKAFANVLAKDKELRAHIRKGWDNALKAGKARGYKFTRQELHDHMKKRYGIKTPPSKDDPDTCLCIK